MKRIVLPSVAWAALSIAPASAASLAPLNSFATQAVTWGSDIGLIAFVAICAALIFAHDHLQAMFGSLTRAVIVIALLVTGSTWLAGLGISAQAGGALIR